MAPSGCGHCYPMILTIHCASCGERFGKTDPQFSCPKWHNNEEPYCLDPAYPGPEAATRQRASKPGRSDADNGDTDAERDSNEPEAFRDLLFSLEAMGFPKSRARTALHAITRQNLDAAIDWLNDNHPPPELVPDSDPTWSKWRPVRSCFFAELVNTAARDWIRDAAIVSLNHARDGKKELCCKEVTHVDVIIRLIGESALFTVRDVPIKDNVAMKDIPVENFVPMKREQGGRPDVKTEAKTNGKGRGDMPEDEELAEAIRRSLRV